MISRSTRRASRPVLRFWWANRPTAWGRRLLPNAKARLHRRRAALRHADQAGLSAGRAGTHRADRRAGTGAAILHRRSERAHTARGARRRRETNRHRLRPARKRRHSGLLPAYSRPAPARREIASLDVSSKDVLRQRVAPLIQHGDLRAGAGQDGTTDDCRTHRETARVARQIPRPDAGRRSGRATRQRHEEGQQQPAGAEDFQTSHAINHGPEGIRSTSGASWCAVK